MRSKRANSSARPSLAHFCSFTPDKCATQTGRRRAQAAARARQRDRHKTADAQCCTHSRPIEATAARLWLRCIQPVHPFTRATKQHTHNQFLVTFVISPECSERRTRSNESHITLTCDEGNSTERSSECDVLVWLSRFHQTISVPMCAQTHARIDRYVRCERAVCAPFFQFHSVAERARYSVHTLGSVCIRFD